LTYIRKLEELQNDSSHSAWIQHGRLPRMTEQELDDALASVPGLSWPAAAWADWRTLPDDLKLSTLQELQASSENPGPDWAGAVLKVLEAFVAVAGGVSGVTGAIAGIQSVKW
jgi:hypothetical protein